MEEENVHTIAKNAVEKGCNMHTVTEKTKKEASEHYGSKELTQEQGYTACLIQQFMGKIHANGIELNRKVLADLAMNHPKCFEKSNRKNKFINLQKIKKGTYFPLLKFKNSSSFLII